MRHLYYVLSWGMTLNEFTILDEMEQRNAILDGVHIGERTDDKHWVLLYQLGDFYVEVFYHKADYVIVKYNPFTKSELLEPYLNEIDISSLLQ